MELKEAFGILGLKEDAQRNEIEKKYATLIKKNRIANLNNTGEGNNVNKIDKIAEAYNRIAANELELIEQEEERKNPSKPNHILKNMGVDEKKLRNFLHYHKIQILLTIIGILVIGLLVHTAVTSVDPELKVFFVGDIIYNDNGVLEQGIEKGIPRIKAVSADGVIITGKKGNLQGSGMVERAAAFLGAGDLDLVIGDGVYFEQCAIGGGFINLDGLIGKLGIEKSRYENYILKLNGREKGHAYGIDVSKSALLKDAGIKGKVMIAAISVDAEHYDKAVKLLELLLK